MAERKKKKASNKKKATTKKTALPGYPNSEELKAYIKKRQEEQGAAEAFFSKVSVLCEEYGPKLGPADAPKIVGRILQAFDSYGQTSYDIGDYGLERTMEEYVSLKIKEYLPRLNTIYQYLIDNKITRRKKWEYTIDGYAFYVPIPAEDSLEEDRRAFCIGRRSRNYLVILFKHVGEDRKGVHIRRIYDNYGDDLRGRSAVSLLQRPDAVEEVTDNIQNYQYVRKPNFKWFSDNDFKQPYQDMRDPGYVLTYNAVLARDRTESALYYYASIKDAFFWIKLCYEAIEEERLSKK